MSTPKKEHRTVLLPMRGLTFYTLTLTVNACSNFALERSSKWRISVRTKDLGGDHDFAWLVVPRGHLGAFGQQGKFGYIGAIETTPNSTFSNQDWVSAGINEKGLSCDTQTLLGTQYPQQSTNATRNLRALQVCQWALAQYSTVGEFTARLPHVTLWGDCATNPRDCKHISVRDSAGDAAVIEFLGGATQVYPDGNDGGKSGFGTMTNQPPYTWHLENVRHNAWKRSLARPAVGMPCA